MEDECSWCAGQLADATLEANAQRTVALTYRNQYRACEADRKDETTECAKDKAALTQKLEESEEEKERRWRPGKVLAAVGLAVLAGFGLGKLHGRGR